MIASLQRQLEWRAVPIAGLAGGVVYLLFTALLAPTVGINVGVFLRYCASLILGSAAVTATDTGTLVAGLIVHFVLSILYAFLIAIVVHRWGLLVGIVGGALIALFVYAINYFTFTLVFPWMFALSSPLMVLSHLGFGMVAGGVYEALDRYDRPFAPSEGA